MHFAALPNRELIGRVLEFADAVDPTTRTVRVFVILSAAPPVIRPGMFASVESSSSRSRQRLFLVKQLSSPKGGTTCLFDSIVLVLCAARSRLWAIRAKNIR